MTFQECNVYRKTIRGQFPFHPFLAMLIGKKKMSPFLAACAATWLHGDIAKKHGQGLISEDIVKGIPDALKRLKNGKFIK